MKSISRSAFMLLSCALFLTSSSYSSEKTITQKIEKRLNQIARIGSAVSIGFWLPSTIRLIANFGPLSTTTETTLISRIGIDATCIAASHNKDSVVLNLLALAGSAASLAFWAPLVFDYPNFFGLSRVALDATQMGLCAQRLYRIYNKHQ